MTDKNLNSDQLADRLDSLLSADQATVPAGDSDPLVDAALRMANAPQPQLPAGMLERVQSRMLEAHQQTVQPQPRSSIRPSRIIHLTRWAVAASFVLVFFLAGLTPALAGSVPGDLLYPVKQALEQVELALATEASDRAHVHLLQAERRIDEAETLLARDTFNPDLVTESLAHLLDAAEMMPSQPTELVTRTTQVVGRLEDVLQQTEQHQVTTSNVVAVASAELQAAREQMSVLMLPTAVEIVSVATPTATQVAVEVLAVPATATPSPTVTSSATNTQTFTPSPTPSATATAIATVTDTPTATPSETATLTSTATMTLIPSPLPTLSTTILTTASGLKATVNATGKVNVRSGPGMYYTVIATLRLGDTVTVIGVDDSNTWLNVVLTDGTVGWVAAYLLTIDETLPVTDPLAETVGSNGQSEVGSGDTGNTSNTGEQGGDFGCEHSGNYCNAPGQENKPSKDDKKDKKDK